MLLHRTDYLLLTGRGLPVEEGHLVCENVSMKNITVTVDDDVHRRVRIKAAEIDTSVSAVVRAFLARWSGEETEFERRKRLQNETLNGIETFRAGDRLPREAVHRHGLVR